MPGRHKGCLLLLMVKTVMPTVGVALPFAGVASEGVRRPRAERVPSSAGVIRPSLDESVPAAEVTLLPAGTSFPGWLPTGVITLQGETGAITAAAQPLLPPHPDTALLDWFHLYQSR